MGHTISRKGGGHNAVGPRAYLEERPSHQSVRLSGRYINIKRLSYDLDMDHSYVTRIISGERANPSYAYLKRIADAFLMTVDELVAAIADRKQERDTELRRRLAS